MTTVLLVRHGLTAATGHALSGWTPGVWLDDRGLAQARALGARLAGLPLDAIVTSPLERCRQTAEVIASAGNGRMPAVQRDVRFAECRYGDWTGKPLRKLAKDPLWRVVQAHPSAARFPGPDAESMLDVQHRAVAAVREWNGKLGAGATYLVCSHGDVIKAIVADSLGLHLDMSQRIQADPCSLTVIRYTPLRPFLMRMNDTGGGIGELMPADDGTAGMPRRAGRRGESDAVIGGGAGAGGGQGTGEGRQRPQDARG